jgi:hypothetical protein
MLFHSLKPLSKEMNTYPSKLDSTVECTLIVELSRIWKLIKQLQEPLFLEAHASRVVCLTCPIFNNFEFLIKFLTYIVFEI